MKWRTVRLADIADIIRGVSFDNSETLDYAAEGTLPILRAGNIQDEVDTLNDLVWVPMQRVSTEQLLKEGDILIAMSSGSIAIVGKTAQMKHDWNGSVGAFCAIVRPKESICPRFLHFYLRGPQFSSWRQSAGIGLNIKNIRRSELESFPIPLPPLDEQRRIVEILDQADRLRKLRRQADAIAERILPALFYKMFGDPVRNEKGWKTMRLDEISEIVTGNTPSRERPQYFGSDIPWARPADLDGQLPVIKTEQGLSQEGALVGRVVPENSILVCCIGATLGKVGLAGVEMAINQQINALLPTEKATPEFLYVMCLLMREVFRAAATQQTLPILNKSRFGQQKGILPPIQLQEQFSQRARELIDQYRQRELSTTTVEKLFNSLLHRAFTGELTKHFTINSGLS